MHGKGQGNYYAYYMHIILLHCYLMQVIYSRNNVRAISLSVGCLIQKGQPCCHKLVPHQTIVFSYLHCTTVMSTHDLHISLEINLTYAGKLPKSQKKGYLCNRSIILAQETRGHKLLKYCQNLKMFQNIFYFFKTEKFLKTS